MKKRHFIKKRKERTKSEDLGYDGGHMFGEPLIWDSTPATRKLWKRLQANLCLGCGRKKTECLCKSNENL